MEQAKKSIEASETTPTVASPLEVAVEASMHSQSVDTDRQVQDNNSTRINDNDAMGTKLSADQETQPQNVDPVPSEGIESNDGAGDTRLSTAEDTTVTQGQTQDAFEGADPEAKPAADLVALNASDTESAEPSEDLEDLRRKVFAAKGTRAVLPPGWEHGQRTPTKGATALSAAMAAELNASSDSDSDSDSDSSSSSSSNYSGSELNDEEFATKVMQVGEGKSDYDSEEEGPRDKTGTAASGPATKNELSKDKACKLFGKLPFDVVPTELMGTIEPLGKVYGNVEEVLVIAQFEQKDRDARNANRLFLHGYNERNSTVLDAGSLVCLASGKVLGLVFETFGSILSPLYSVILESASQSSSLLKEEAVYYLPSHSSLLRPAELRAQQGKPSDASNVHDEEPNEYDADEMEFSDDEEEAEWRRRLKEKRRSNKRTAEVMGGDGDAKSALTGGGSGGRGGKAARGSRGASTRGRGRGRGGLAAGGPSGAAMLPPRPRWHLDDPATNGSSSDPTNLLYDSVVHPMLYGEGESDRAESQDTRKSLAKPPASAGLPANPMLASSAAAVQSSMVQMPLGPELNQVQKASGDRPPPSAHINPLFAHRWVVSSSAIAGRDAGNSTPSATQAGTQPGNTYQLIYSAPFNSNLQQDQYLPHQAPMHHSPYQAQVVQGTPDQPHPWQPSQGYNSSSSYSNAYPHATKHHVSYSQHPSNHQQQYHQYAAAPSLPYIGGYDPSRPQPSSSNASQSSIHAATDYGHFPNAPNGLSSQQ